MISILMAALVAFQPTLPSGVWTVEPGDGSASVSASLPGGGRASLFCTTYQEGGPEFRVVRSDISTLSLQDDQVTAEITIDGGEPVRQRWFKTYDAVYAEGAEQRALFARLAGAASVAVVLTDSQGRSVEVSIPVDGASAGIGQVYEACGFVDPASDAAPDIARWTVHGAGSAMAAQVISHGEDVATVSCSDGAIRLALRSRLFARSQHLDDIPLTFVVPGLFADQLVWSRSGDVAEAPAHAAPIMAGILANAGADRFGLRVAMGNRSDNAVFTLNGAREAISQVEAACAAA